MQRLTSLVVEAHDRASHAEHRTRQMQQAHSVMQRKVLVIEKRLETATVHLFRYRCRAEAAERLGVSESRLKLQTEGSLARYVIQ